MQIKIIFLLLIITVITGCSKKEKTEQKMPMEMEQSKIPGYASFEMSSERIQLIGVLTDKVAERELIKKIRTVGLVEVDERNIANIQTKFKGWIEKLYVNFTGILVKQGDQLFSVYSPELLATQEEYLLALKNLDKRPQGVYGKEFQKSDQELFESAKRRLELWDVPDDEINRLNKTRKPFKTLTFFSPIEGIVLNKNAFIGMNVEPGMNIFTVADLAQVWIIADIYEQDLSLIQLGQKGTISFLSFPGKPLQASVVYINYVLEQPTRTAKIRFDVDNVDYRLKPGMYATVEISLDLGKFLSIPDSAIINTGERKIVFVAKGNGVFVPRDIQTGWKAEEYVQVLSGLSEGEEVVTSAQFLLDSESRIRASQGKMPGHGDTEKK